MRSRLALGALAAALVLSLSSSRPGRAEDDAVATFKADLARLLDRYNDDAAAGRLDKGIAVCNSRLAIKADDTSARLELASFKLAKDDYEGAAAEAERAAQDSKDRKGDQRKQATAIAFAALIAGAEVKLHEEKDPTKAAALLARVQANVNEKEKAFIEIAGGNEAAIEILATEQERVENLKWLGEVGAPVRAIEKTDTAGKEIKLDAYAGKVLLIDFWATTCEGCLDELPNEIATYEKWNAKGFEVLGVSLDVEKAALDVFVKEKRVPWRQYFDGKGWENDVAKAWSIHAIPKTYLVDHTGKIRFVGVRGDELAKAVQELIGRADRAKPKEPTK